MFILSRHGPERTRAEIKFCFGANRSPTHLLCCKHTGSIDLPRDRGQSMIPASRSKGTPLTPNVPPARAPTMAPTVSCHGPGPRPPPRMHGSRRAAAVGRTCRPILGVPATSTVSRTCGGALRCIRADSPGHLDTGAENHAAPGQSKPLPGHAFCGPPCLFPAWDWHVRIVRLARDRTAALIVHSPPPGPAFHLLGA